MAQVDSSKPKIGVLLSNLGTPDAPRTREVRRYLAQFLSDPRVIDINPIGRWLLLNAIILRVRPAKSAHAYQAIWTERGSPLLFHTQDLVEKVRTLLGPDIPVELGMRYGNPSLDSALDALRKQDVERVVLFPLYPQYAASSTASTLAETFRLATDRWDVPAITAVPAFYDHPLFINAFRTVAEPILKDFAPDHVLLSFHGLPERHMLKSDPTGGTHCLRASDCCAQVTTANRTCYRAQCYATARALARALSLSDGQHSVSFQSRLGRTPWVKPYTDEVLVELAKQGVKRLAVMCPAFVADCLETLEEIGIRARADFKAAGGQELILVHSLNASDVWAEAVASMVRQTAGVGLPAPTETRLPLAP